MISVTVVVKIFATYAGCWALGYGAGTQVAFIKKMLGAA